MILQEIKTIEDVDIIKSFYHDIFPEEPKYDCIDFTNSVTGNHNYDFLKYYFAIEDNNIVGFCGIYSNNEEDAWLGWFGIKPEFRRKGLAQRMLDMLFYIMLEKRYRYCRLYTDKVLNNNAYQLYLKNGFVEDSQYEYNFVTMVKDVFGMTVPKDKYWKEKTPLGFESEPPHHAN